MKASLYATTVRHEFTVSDAPPVVHAGRRIRPTKVIVNWRQVSDLPWRNGQVDVIGWPILRDGADGVRPARARLLPYEILPYPDWVTEVVNQSAKRLPTPGD